jgi:hypothetical protein
MSWVVFVLAGIIEAVLDKIGELLWGGGGVAA